MTQLLEIRTAEAPEDITHVRELFEEYQRFLGLCLCFQGFTEELAALPGKYGPPSGRLYLAVGDALPPLPRAGEGRGEGFQGTNVGRAALTLTLSRTRERGYPAGCAAFYKLAEDVCELKRLYVRPGFKGQGLGRRLLALAMRDAKAAGYAKMRLDSLKRLKEARTLYESFGFTEILPYNHNTQEDVYYMERVL